LVRLGYVRQARGHGDYLLTTKLVSMGLSYLSNSGIVDIAQPLLNATSLGIANAIAIQGLGHYNSEDIYGL